MSEILTDEDYASPDVIEHLMGSPDSNGAVLQASATTLPRFWTLGELRASPSLMQPPVCQIPNLAYAGRTTLLSGMDKAGKSTLMTQAISEKTRGGEFLGAVLEPARVAWMALDEGLPDFVQRACAFGADDDDLFIIEEPPDTVEDFEQIVREIKPAVVVVDVLHRWWLGKVLNENDSAQVNAFLTPRIRVARTWDVALVLLHHTDKGGWRYRGSSDIGASVDIRGILKSRATVRPAHGEEEEERIDDGRRTLTVIGRAGIRANLALSFDGTRYSLGSAPLPLPERILRKLEDGRASVNQLVQMLNKRRGDVLEAIRRLRSEGYVADVKSLISITEPGRWLLKAGKAGTTPEPARNHPRR